MEPINIDRERRSSVRSHAASNVLVYCPALDLRRMRPCDISARGTFVNTGQRATERGDPVQLIFMLDTGKIVKMIRVDAHVARISNKGLGFSFIAKAKQSA